MTGKTAFHGVQVVDARGSTAYHEMRHGRLARPGLVHAQRLRIVCDPCNTGWMSRLQSKTRDLLLPLIKAETKEILEIDALVLAKWASMFAYVWEQAEPALITSTQKDREHFKDSAQSLETPFIDPQLSVYMARYDGEFWSGQVWRRARAFKANGVACALALTTVDMGKVVLHVCSTPPPLDLVGFAETMNLRVLYPHHPLNVSEAGTLSDEEVRRLTTEIVSNPEWLAIDRSYQLSDTITRLDNAAFRTNEITFGNLHVVLGRDIAFARQDEGNET
jgi:hypothetical protein